MDLQLLTEHASRCRVWADELSGKHDREMLLKIAQEFDISQLNAEPGRHLKDRRLAMFSVSLTPHRCSSLLDNLIGAANGAILRLGAST